MKCNNSEFNLHSKLRSWCKTLNAMCIIEIIIISLFTWMSLDIVIFLKEFIATNSHNKELNGLVNTAIMGITALLVPLSASVFGAVKSISSTFRKDG